MTQLSQVKVAAIQMVSGTDFFQNLKDAELLIMQASNSGAKLVVLPEYFAIMGQTEKGKLALAEPHGQGQLQSFLARMAKDHQVWIVGGSHAIKSSEENRPLSRCYVFNPEGKAVAWYDKIHLFDVTVDDNTKTYRESKHSQPGNLVSCVDTPFGQLGLSICYDLRFPEQFRQMAELGMEILAVPAAFTATTGAAHWQVLLQARAIENQIYVIAAAQGGQHQNGRQTWGHSVIISPWGEILAELGTGEGVLTAELDLKYLQKIRREFPVLTHRRL